MNIKQMRKIDLYFGGFICLCLDIYARATRVLRSKKKCFSKPKKILVTKYLGMGSILLATPMLRALKKKYPDSSIVFMTFESNAAFALRLEDIDEVRGLRTTSFFSFSADLFRHLWELRLEKLDIVFDLEFFARFSTIVSYLSGAKMRVGYYLPKLWRGDLLTYQVHFNPHRHVTEVLAAQLEPLAIKADDLRLSPPTVVGEDEEKIKSLLVALGISNNRNMIVVNVNASELSKERMWPKENFIELIGFLVLNSKKSNILLVGSPNEAQYVQTVYSALPENVKASVTNLSGKVSIGEFLALVKQSRLLITNDSGPLHIAAALGTQTISFFGPESPLLYGPVGDNHTVFYAGIYCSPCLNVYNAKTALCKGDNTCMKNIKTSYVIDRIKEDKAFSWMF